MSIISYGFLHLWSFDEDAIFIYFFFSFTKLNLGWLCLIDQIDNIRWIIWRVWCSRDTLSSVGLSETFYSFSLITWHQIISSRHVPFGINIPICLLYVNSKMMWRYLGFELDDLKSNNKIDFLNTDLWWKTDSTENGWWMECFFLW